MDLKKFIQERKSEFDEIKTSEQLDASFGEKLKSELHQPKKGKVISMQFFSIAASIALLISVGFWSFQNQQQKEFKSQIIADLGNDSTGTRLEAVYEFNDAYAKEDSQIIDALIKTLLKDSNANVKIATIEALLKFPQNEKIRTNLIKALPKENQPLVQIKLIKALESLREQRATEPLKEIINDEKTFDIVKSNATLAMANLKQ